MALQISQDKLCIMQQKIRMDQGQINMILLAILKNKHLKHDSTKAYHQ